MNSETLNSRAFGLLQQFSSRKPDIEHCELCSADITGVHEHLVDLSVQSILCACTPCAILFCDPGTKYRRIPKDIRRLNDFKLNDAFWESLMFPIGLAFFFYSSPRKQTKAYYPSPAGAVESLLHLEAWSALEKENAPMKEMKSDVEALLINRVERDCGPEGHEYYIVPIDECYRLVGLIRANWRGLSGGTEVWREIAGFFTDLKEHCNSGEEKVYA
jgi:hypothetical protein